MSSWKALPMHASDMMYAICFMPFEWPLCSRVHKLPPCHTLGMKVCRNPLCLIMDTILLFQPLFKLHLCTETMNSFNCLILAYQYLMNKDDNLQSSIHDPSPSTVLPKPQIHDCCVLHYLDYSDPCTSVATWRSFGWSCGNSNTAVYALWMAQ